MNELRIPDSSNELAERLSGSVQESVRGTSRIFLAQPFLLVIFSTVSWSWASASPPFGDPLAKATQKSRPGRANDVPTISFRS